CPELQQFLDLPMASDAMETPSDSPLILQLRSQLHLDWNISCSRTVSIHRSAVKLKFNLFSNSSSAFPKWELNVKSLALRNPRLGSFCGQKLRVFRQSLSSI